MTYFPLACLTCDAFYSRAVELGITAEDLIMAEEQEVVSSPRRLPVVDSDSEVTKALVCTSCICALSVTEISVEDHQYCTEYDVY